MKRALLTFLTLLILSTGFSQKELAMPPVPAIRVLHHDAIVSSLNAISRLSGNKDTVFAATQNKSLNSSINRSVQLLVNNMRASIELNDNLSNNDKFKWLRGINEMLTAFISGYKAHIIKPVLLPGIVKAYNDAMQLDIAGTSIASVITDNALEVGNILVENYALKESNGIADAKNVLVLKTCQRYPRSILPILSQHPENPYADSLIIIAALTDQDQLYSYALGEDALGKRIQATEHPLVKLICKIAAIKTGRMYFPFLDDIYNGKIQIDSITPFLKQEAAESYYKLLVKTRIRLVTRIQQGDTPMAMQALTNKIRSEAVELYINEINGLHEVSNPNIRFKQLNNLSAPELYYIAVLGEEELYTSSFVNGVYARIMQRLRRAKSDTLLDEVNNDYYKKFIKMCAAYNTLDDFLDRMDKPTAQKLMQNFVNNLEKTSTLEDAVDVADSYASIYNTSTRKLMLQQIYNNLQENEAVQNKRGGIIYNLLNTIFLSMDPANKIDVSEQLGIDPIYKLPGKLLTDTAGRIVIEQFFYGYDGGVADYNTFINSFRNSNWKIIKNAKWVEVSSLKGTPVSIYSNLPLDEKKDLDEEAQSSLVNYLHAENIKPTIVIHRGHSYYLNSTIAKLAPSAKLVLLGSCGGYQMLNQILHIAAGAHIISSKQTGSVIINQELIRMISENLREGKDLNWPAIWKTLETRFFAGNSQRFDDYVPPYKNLGSIFIMAYDKAWQD